MLVSDPVASSGRSHGHSGDRQEQQGRAADPAAALRGTETILLVEDDAAVRTATRRLLERFGYMVLETARAHDALDRAVIHKGPLDVLLTDLVMPEMSGTDLAAKIVMLRPEVRVVFTSGYDEETLVNRNSIPRNATFLPKPFSALAIAVTIRDVLRS
jgi:two-component system cell cycle sensor histidine kinase/response regulator CckA